ncbi:2-polyprenyl-6-methoxyphenol hydroxylase [Nonomuraea sp. MG754425]|uniref:FAD-dependent monooxygenase n=1 Tax=Nonomuraea sp. MG754425 TaxID=2570319 RepID=UPI002351C072|nr:FAD-dependent monooxygenase [Nonomuraea sp. MG754425]MCF6468449.1 2-polyprenyl-6-methoxyphenol hydroxylase [Nonomuraea sp. MG754425]
MTGYDVDVLVAGAGPVGLMAASRLARSGVSVRLVDAATGPATTSRALGCHARSLEIYDQLGVLGEIAPHGTRINTFVIHQDGRPNRLDFDFAGLPTRFPYMFNVDQVIIERVLRGDAAAAGVAVEWNTRLESFQYDDAAVTAVLRSGDGAGAAEETVRARYLWGCDGGHSTVRKTLQLPLTGEPAHTWLIADAIVHTDVDIDGVHWLFPPGGTLMLFPFPEPGKWRLLDTTGEGQPDNPEQIARQLSTKLSQALGRDTVVDRPSWASKFTIQQRAVPAMHVGRCFVSGDAAHVHSPASGQGLNTGIQDAYNLAWKLTMVIHGHADATLLDTYDAERVPIGQALLASTGEVMNTVMVGATHHAQSSTGSVDSARNFQHQLIRNMSGLAIAYPDSPLTVPCDKPGEGPRPGERLTQLSAADAQSPGWTILRAELRSPAWHLLVFTGSEDATGQDHLTAQSGSLPAWVDTVTINRRRPDNDHGVWDPDSRVHDTLAATDGDWILVRPDGYVSARGTGDAGLRAALNRLTSLHTPE